MFKTVTEKIQVSVSLIKKFTILNITCLSRLLVSMAPLSREVRPVTSLSPPHLGPAVPEVNTLWFKLFIYHMTGYGPPSLLLTKGKLAINWTFLL